MSITTTTTTRATTTTTISSYHIKSLLPWPIGPIYLGNGIHQKVLKLLGLEGRESGRRTGECLSITIVARPYDVQCQITFCTTIGRYFEAFAACEVTSLGGILGHPLRSVEKIRIFLASVFTAEYARFVPCYTLYYLCVYNIYMCVCGWVCICVCENEEEW